MTTSKIVAALAIVSVVLIAGCAKNNLLPMPIDSPSPSTPSETPAPIVIHHQTTVYAPINLRTAGNYAILAGSLISNVPNSAVTGNVGLSPAAGSKASK